MSLNKGIFIIILIALFIFAVVYSTISFMKDPEMDEINAILDRKVISKDKIIQMTNRSKWRTNYYKKRLNQIMGEE